MYDINNKILPKSAVRQKIFDEFIHFGYTKPRIREYYLLRECEIANFGFSKTKNTDIKTELKNMLTSYSLLAYFKGINLLFDVEGEANGYFLAERFEFFICKLIFDAAQNSVDKKVFIKIKFSNKQIRLTLRFEGKPIRNLSKKVYAFSVGKHQILNFKEGFVKTKVQNTKPKTVYEWLIDRLSDVNISINNL